MHHHRLRVAIGILCTVALLFAGANTANATSKPKPGDTAAPEAGDTRDGEGIEDLDIPAGWVETLPDPDLLNQPVPEPDIAFTVGVGTDGHYCGSFYIKHISYTFNYNGGDYTRIHVQVTRRYLYLGEATLLLAGVAWNAVKNCIRSGGPHGIYVRSWAAMEDQFLCHAAAAASSRAIAALIGTSWDLEGHRYPTNNPYTWATTGCNW